MHVCSSMDGRLNGMLAVFARLGSRMAVGGAREVLLLAPASKPRNVAIALLKGYHLFPLCCCFAMR